MGIIVSIIGALAGMSGMIFAFIGLNHNRMAAVTSYLEYTKVPDFIEARSVVLGLSSYDPQTIDENRHLSTQVENVINTYNMVGLLVRKRQLPKWFLKETAAGDLIVKFYGKLEPYILYRRAKDDIETYANQFEYLCGLLKRKKTEKPTV